MEVYPFFLECSKYEIGSKRKQLQQLSLGNGGLIVNGRVLILDDEPFTIPDEYNESDKIKLNKTMWNEDTDFFKLQSDIAESRTSWSNMKKREKLRLIDLYLLKRFSDLEECVRAKTAFNMALLLKMISQNDVEYRNYEIKSLSGDVYEFILSLTRDSNT